jgi:precorrin-6B methylase 2
MPFKTTPLFLTLASSPRRLPSRHSRRPPQRPAVTRSYEPVRDSADPQGALSSHQADVLRMVYGAQTAQVIYVAAKLGVADLLTDGPRASTELAPGAGVDESILRRVLRGLVSLGLCIETEGDRFALTEMGQYLRSDSPDSLRPRAVFNGEVLFPIWGELLNTVRTGESGALRVFNMPLYEYFAQHPEVGGLFDRTMASAARYRLGPAIAAYDFSRFRTIVDVGGGNGALLIAILRRFTGPQGIAFDLPAVTERARQNIEAAGLTGRCNVVGGNAVEMVPEGGDCYILSAFLIDMSDARAISILQNCRRAITAGGVLLLIEWVMPSSGEARDSYKFWDTASIDLIMLATGGTAGGRVRTAAEFRALLEAGGFALNRIVATGSSVSVIEARPA